MENSSNFPRNAVVAILTGLPCEDPPKEYRENVRPHNKARVSPRVFWNVVRHCLVGPGKVFGAALREELPEQDRTRSMQYRLSAWCCGREREPSTTRLHLTPPAAATMSTRRTPREREGRGDGLH